MTTAKNHPVDECAKAADELINKGLDVFQKFTCEKCGARQTMPDKNVFYTYGRCEECDHVTDIRKTGCNYLVMASGAEAAAVMLARMLKDSKPDEDGFDG